MLLAWLQGSFGAALAGEVADSQGIGGEDSQQICEDKSGSDHHTCKTAPLSKFWVAGRGAGRTEGVL